MRDFCLSIAITFGTESLISQLFFLHFSSFLILTLMGVLRPFETRGILWLEIYNEFSSRLLLLCLLMCQTDMVSDLGEKYIMCQAMIVLIYSNIVVNFGLTLFLACQIIWLKIRICHAKRQSKIVA